ncbi:MAG: hypothetical protein HY705_10700 [Gemmatimonadetes bacterium]|nr:hypothetical protein [Gemmatimonadota bacterium]
MNTKLYGKVVGVVLLLLGVIGFLTPTLAGINLGKKHSLVHLATGAVLAWVGFGQTDEGLAKNLVLVFGVIYLALGVLGFVREDLILYHAEVRINVIHLVIGLWAIAAAMMGGKAVAPQA